jgi:magnesium transporter
MHTVREQSIEACNSNMQSIIHIREAYTSIASNNLNRTIKILTTLTVLIMLPSLFYGMYGMNIGLPFQGEAWAFAGIIAFTLIVNIIVIVVARRKRIF